MNEDLLERLRQLMQVPADATRTPAPARQPTIGPAPSEASQARPQPRQGLFQRVVQSAEPSPDTPAGWANEMLNPVRAGAQARELVGDAVQSARRGNIGRAAGMGALAAMSVPGMPGPDDAARVARGVRGADVPETLTAASIFDPRTGKRYDADFFEGGHLGAWNRFVDEELGLPVMPYGEDRFERVLEMNRRDLGKRRNEMVDGFLTSTGRFVDRSEALEIARNRHAILKSSKTLGDYGLLSEDMQRALPRPPKPK